MEISHNRITNANGDQCTIMNTRYKAVRWALDREGIVADTWGEIVPLVHAWMRQQPGHTVVWVYKIDENGEVINTDFGPQAIRSIHMSRV